MCACVTPTKSYPIPSSPEVSRDPSVASCAGVAIRLLSFHPAFCLRLHSASGFLTPPAPPLNYKPSLCGSNPGIHKGLLLCGGLGFVLRDILHQPLQARNPLKAAPRLETTVYSAPGRHPNDQSGSRISQQSRQGTAHPQGRVPAGERASSGSRSLPAGAPPASRVRTRAQGSVAPQLGRDNRDPAERLLGPRPAAAWLDHEGRSGGPGVEPNPGIPGTHGAARRPARAPLRVRHPQSRFRTRHPAPHRSYGEPQGPKSRGPRAGRRAEVSAAAVGPAVVGCAALAAPWLACGSRAGRPAGLRSGLGRRPGFCCARLRRGPGRRRRARGRGQAAEGGDGVRACGRRLGEETGPWTRGARCPRLGAAGTEPKMSA